MDGLFVIWLGISSRVDKWFKADSSSIEALKVNLAEYQKIVVRIPNLTDLMIILAVGLGLTGLAYIGADIIAPWISLNAPQLAKLLTSKFFWLIVIATSGGLILSFTKLKKYEGAGASKVGSVLYILVATIGMKMDALVILDNPGLFLIGLYGC